MQCGFKLQKEAGALCVECCGYTTELFTHSAFQFIEKKAFQEGYMAQYENDLLKDSYVNRTQ